MPDATQAPGWLSSLPAGRKALAVGLAVTLLVAGLSYLAPLDYAATVVGLAFLLATAVLVLRRDAETIRHYGLSLGGLLEPTPLDRARLVRSALRACGWAFGLLAVLVVPFTLGFRAYWQVHTGFHFRPPVHWVDEILGQVLVIALPEEAFYRGYLLTALDDAWGTPWRIAGANLGKGFLVSSALFALGHLLTEPEPSRLAVFFPALLFSWLRARTGGIGAPLLFHALCNLLAETITRGYGF